MRKIWIFILTIVLLSVFIIFWGIYGQEKPEAAYSNIFYVPNAGEGTISVIDPEKGKVIETISLGTSQASHGIALSRDGKTLFAGTGFDGKSLVTINTETKEVLKEIKFESGVHGIDISADGQFLYVTLMNGLGKGEGKLGVYKTSNMQKITEVNTGGGPAHVAVTSDGTQVWVANVNGNTVAIFDAKNNKIIKTLSVGEVPNEVAISPDGKWAFVANVDSNLITVIDVNKLEVVKSISTGKAPHGVTVSPDSKEVWVANNKSNDVSIIDIETFKVKAIIPVGAFANHIAFSSDGKWAYVTNRQSNNVVKIDTITKKVIANIPVGIEPHEITLEDYYGTVKGSKGFVQDVNSSSEVKEKDKEPKNESVTVQSEGIEIEAKRLSSSDIDENASIDYDQFDGFLLTLSAHAGDLTSLQIEEKIFLITKLGERIKPSQWIVKSNDSHHPQYLVLFSRESIDFATPFILEIGGIGDKNILLDWNLGE